MRYFFVLDSKSTLKHVQLLQNSLNEFTICKHCTQYLGLVH